MLYQAKRYQTEILQWTPFVGTSEVFRMMRSPTATARPIERGLGLIRLGLSIVNFTSLSKFQSIGSSKINIFLPLSAELVQ